MAILQPQTGAQCDTESVHSQIHEIVFHLFLHNSIIPHFWENSSRDRSVCFGGQAAKGDVSSA